MSVSIVKQDMLRDALETCFGSQAFETRSLRRLIDAGFHFTYGPTEFCALIQTVSFCTTVQRKDFCLPHGLQRALR